MVIPLSVLLSNPTTNIFYSFCFFGLPISFSPLLMLLWAQLVGVRCILCWQTSWIRFLHASYTVAHWCRITSWFPCTDISAIVNKVNLTCSDISIQHQPNRKVQPVSCLKPVVCPLWIMQPVIFPLLNNGTKF